MLHLSGIDNLKIALGAVIFFFAALLYTNLACAAAFYGVNLSGYYKNLFTASESLSGRSFTGDLNRLRLDFDASPFPGIDLKVIYDNEAVLGSVLDTPEFRAAGAAGSVTYFDLDRTSVDRDYLYWRQSLYRAYISCSRGMVTLTVGRQRVALGTGRLWNPEDLLNPVSPLAVERDERRGVDAVAMDISLGAVTGLKLVYGPGRGWNREILFARMKGNLRGYDLSVLFGSFRGNSVLGLDFSGYIGESGFRGESTYTFSQSGPDFLRLVLSFDHTFQSSLYVLAEYLYNGGNRPTGLSPVELSRFDAQIATRNRNFFGFLAGYDLTPLIRLDILTVLDMDDGSLFLGPTVSYNIMENIDLSAGVQLFAGKNNSEYGDLPDLYTAELKWYF